ncbi:MAG: hypothetical protein JWM82_1305, partial [Myxococcales bacterium]|nr:hypothetical protein [Myxococcales bacterium]
SDRSSRRAVTMPGSSGSIGSVSAEGLDSGGLNSGGSKGGVGPGGGVKLRQHYADWGATELRVYDETTWLQGEPKGDIVAGGGRRGAETSGRDRMIGYERQ